MLEACSVQALAWVSSLNVLTKAQNTGNTPHLFLVLKIRTSWVLECSTMGGSIEPRQQKEAFRDITAYSDCWNTRVDEHLGACVTCANVLSGNNFSQTQILNLPADQWDGTA